MYVHLVFVAKYRRKVFDLDSIEKLCSYFASVCADFDVELVDMDGECNHVHLLINYPPKLIKPVKKSSLITVKQQSTLLIQRPGKLRTAQIIKGILGAPSYTWVEAAGSVTFRLTHLLSLISIGNIFAFSTEAKMFIDAKNKDGSLCLNL